MMQLKKNGDFFTLALRAHKEHVLITYTKHRYSYGQMIDQFPSRFLHEIPESFNTTGRLFILELAASESVLR